jgi:hypothetical protein
MDPLGVGPIRIDVSAMRPGFFNHDTIMTAASDGGVGDGFLKRWCLESSADTDDVVGPTLRGRTRSKSGDELSVQASHQ